MHPALDAIRKATEGTPYEGALWLVGGALRDALLGRPEPNDFDLVLESSAIELAGFLRDAGISTIHPVVYPRFGTALVRVAGADIELVTARRESYADTSRKPDVEPATLAEDALRRDFTINTLMQNLHSGELRDPLGLGERDLRDRVLRTPLDPAETFHDDPLRMLRAVRFCWQIGLTPTEELLAAIRAERERLRIISAERIRDELVKMLTLPTSADALDDLMALGLIEIFAPELQAMVGVEQGHFHHLDVWQHSLLVLRNVPAGDLVLALGALLHDVGKPPTRFIDEEGHTRFFGHEGLGAQMAEELLRRLKFPTEVVEPVKALVRNHMRLGSSPIFTPSAARRVVRDLGDQTGRLLDLVEADTLALRPGVKVMDLAPIRAQIERVRQETPRETLESPLDGREIMDLLVVPPGEDVGRAKTFLRDQVLDGALAFDDKDAARERLRDWWSGERSAPQNVQ